MVTNDTDAEIDKFPWGTVGKSIVAWFIPLIVYFVLSYTQVNDLLLVVVLMLVVVAIPVLALVLYFVDKRRADGYISIWGYR